MSCVLIDARTGTARSKTRTTRPLLTLIPRLPPIYRQRLLRLSVSSALRAQSAAPPPARRTGNLSASGDMRSVWTILTALRLPLRP
ncbi:hypothetical protein CHARACLAT_005646 [Characodon lateralis]|uniref:Uncharacterized protein n=1 Tax=Characodon lateralis TaxID=208331 RepID=A0ABU7DE06_9TELE|nr:hypothetical protein [Characodon lateralis]